MVVESIRDRKLVKLYLVLTGKEENGTIDPDTISMLYSMLCLDNANIDLGKRREMSETEIMLLAKELYRAAEVQCNDESDDISLKGLAEGMIRCLDDMSYREVKKMNSFDLKKELGKRYALD